MGAAHQLLPFDSAIKRGSSVRQNSVDAANVYTLFCQEIAESPLFLGRNVRDVRFWSPKFLPICKAIPCRRSAGQPLRMLKPVTEKYSLD